MEFSRFSVHENVKFIKTNSCIALDKLNSLAFFSQAYRPFFLCGASFSVIAIAIWGLLLNGDINWHSTLPPVFWHAHEMIFGFVASILAGFLFTAVRHWTGHESISARPLFALIFLWITARVLFFICFFYVNEHFQLLFLIALTFQICWWSFFTIALSRIVIAAKNKGNYIFIVLLGLFSLANIAVGILALLGHVETALQLTHVAIFLVSIVAGIITGRVIPFFTSRVIVDYQPSVTPYLNTALLITSFAGASIYLLGHFFKISIYGFPIKACWVMFLISALHSCRAYLWFTPAIFRHPFLWSLHLAYLCLAIGMFFLGLSYLSISALAFKDALHVITIGTIGLMMLSMMCRVTLGHTNRKIASNRFIHFSFILMIFAAISRGFANVIPFASVISYWKLSAFLWFCSFAIFLWQFTRFLLTPRAS